MQFGNARTEKRYGRYLRHWRKCRACPLHELRSKVVFGRGSHLPCDILFVGEAPGHSEDHIGQAFVGPSGQILDELIIQSGSGWSYYIDNTVACLPFEAYGGEACEKTESSMREPTEQEAEKCGRRLRELYGLANPKGVALLGSVAKKYVVLEAPTLNLLRPSFIARQGGIASYEFRSSVHRLTEFLSEVL